MRASNFRYVLVNAPPSQPMELAFNEEDLPLWQALQRELRGEEFALSGDK